jgi:hypothetical protein
VKRPKKASKKAKKAAPSRPATKLSPPPIRDDLDGDGLTQDKVDDLVLAVQSPLPRRFAALKCGVSPKTFERLLQDGASGVGSRLAVELARRVYQFEAQDVGEEMQHLKTLAAHNPQATETYLRVMHPADFGGFVRKAPDEFESPHRQQRTQDRLLDHPPPRMLAKFKTHGWFRMPSAITPEDRASVLGILDRYELRALTAGPPTEGGSDAEATEDTAGPA